VGGCGLGFDILFSAKARERRQNSIRGKINTALRRASPSFFILSLLLQEFYCPVKQPPIQSTSRSNLSMAYSSINEIPDMLDIDSPQFPEVTYFGSISNFARVRMAHPA